MFWIATKYDTGITGKKVSREAGINWQEMESTTSGVNLSGGQSSWAPKNLPGAVSVIIIDSSYPNKVSVSPIASEVAGC